ncbi:MAG: hypothetical protein ACFB9M_07335 [Myxococcota bacterium]
MKALFPLDDGLGPAQPIDEVQAELMVARALEAAEPVASRPMVRRRELAAACVATFLLFGSGAWAAWRVGILVPPQEEPVSEPVPEPIPEMGAPEAQPGFQAAESSLSSSPRLALEQAGDAPSPEDPPERGAGRSGRAGEPRSRRASGADRPPSESIDLLAAANRYRRLGAWVRAEATYLRVAREPRMARPARQTAWVAVGNLRLERTHDHRGARIAFERAIGIEGPLMAEARWGLARALRVLGDREAEHRVLNELIRFHPSRPEAARARSRLEEP